MPISGVTLTPRSNEPALQRSVHRPSRPDPLTSAKTTTHCASLCGRRHANWRRQGAFRGTTNESRARGRLRAVAPPLVPGFLEVNGLLRHPGFRDTPLTLEDCSDLAHDLGEPDGLRQPFSLPRSAIAESSRWEVSAIAPATSRVGATWVKERFGDLRDVDRSLPLISATCTQQAAIVSIRACRLQPVRPVVARMRVVPFCSQPRDPQQFHDECLGWLRAA
jgi:hypothetical protein